MFVIDVNLWNEAVVVKDPVETVETSSGMVFILPVPPER